MGLNDLSLLLLQSVYLDYRKTGLWVFGLSRRYHEELNSCTIKSFAEGYCFTLKPSSLCGGYVLSNDLTDSQDQQFRWMGSNEYFFSTTTASLFSLMKIPITIREQISVQVNSVLTRGVTGNQTLQLAEKCMSKLNMIRMDGIKEDDQFWQSCPRIESDWLEHWKRG